VVGIETLESTKIHDHVFQLLTLRRGTGRPILRAGALRETLVVGGLLPFLVDARSHGQRRPIQMLEYLIQHVHVSRYLILE
jgi:hypothetical protein